MKPSYVYVASSWRNEMQADVCATLKAAGIEHYDFKNPEGRTWTKTVTIRSTMGDLAVETDVLTHTTTCSDGRRWVWPSTEVLSVCHDAICAELERAMAVTA
jgi:hypothetical protein